MRKERLAQQIKEEVSNIVREKVADPRIQFMSIVDVGLSADLKQAKIFVSIFGDEKQKKETFQGLESATGFIRSELAKVLTLRLMPTIVFVRDDSWERGSRVLHLLSKIKNESKETPKKKHPR